MLRERVDDAAIGHARAPYDQRYVVRLVEPAELVQHVVIAEVLAVVAREDHQRAVGLPGCVEPVENAGDLVVDLGEHAVVGRLQLALLSIVVGRLQERMVDHHGEQRMLRALFRA